MKKLIVGGLAALAIGLAAAPVAGADCCEGEFDWATPYVDALYNHGIGGLVERDGIPVVLIAEELCQGASARDIARENNKWLALAQMDKIAAAVYADVCPEARP